VSGGAGVGKTRLAREALAEASQEGFHIEWVQATQAAASIPLGAFAALPADAEARDRLGVLQACAQTLRVRGGGHRVVLGVDDAHLLDSTSAALVSHVATTGTAFVVVTVRAGSPCPDPIVALWKDLEVSRLELQRPGRLVSRARGLGLRLGRGLAVAARGGAEHRARRRRARGAPPVGTWKLVFDRVGAWELASTADGVVDQYDAEPGIIHVSAPIQMAPLTCTSALSCQGGVSRVGYHPIGGQDCNEAGPFGTYQWAVNGSTLTLTAIDEGCPDRGDVWAGTWTRTTA
jgi:hypothetical protein